MATPPPAAAVPWPLFDLFLDLPHPAASPKCPPSFVIKPPDEETLVTKELGDEASVNRIVRFAFPEHDDRAPPPPTPPSEGGSGLNRNDVYWIQHKGFSCHTFSLQVSDGTRVHGHVRRYLPQHLQAPSRWDVGRRGVRALVLLTRAAGGDQLFGSILKSVEAISCQQAATPADTHPSSQPQAAFLRALHRNHVAICKAYLEKPDDKRAPMVLTLQGAEFGNEPKFLEVDTSRFLLPTSIMKPGDGMVSACSVGAILPLLRCCGVPNSLRLMSALLSERRVLLISASPTRLTNCARSALCMLAQGMLHWQHLFIPVLPPHLIQYLAAPMPYLIGCLTNISGKIQEVQEIGEVLILNLDNNQMETRGMQASQVMNKIPDLCSRPMTEEPTGYQQQLSASEELMRDLTEICKADKRTLSGESALQEGTKEAVKKVGRAFGKLKQKGKLYLQKQSNSSVGVETPNSTTPPPPEPDVPDEVNHQEADYVYTESCQNEAAEEEARISFTCFFLSLIGDMRWYLSQTQAGQPPSLDRNKFIQSKRALGDTEGTAIYPLLVNLVQTQMFEQFCKQRVQEVSSRAPVPRDAPLFLRCTNQHRASRIDFTNVEIRRVTRELAQTSPSRFLVQSNATARRLAMGLTSNTAYQGDYQEALSRLTESCREASAVLFDVMSVVWLRIRDSKGMQWKHGLYALHILRNLILHGPLAAVAEATDGLDKIRALKSHSDNLRAKQAQQVRDAATQVYALLVDRAMLFWARRVCANSRRLVKNPPQGRLTRDARLRVTIRFQNIHAAMAPTGHRPSVAPQPPAVAPGRQQPQQQRVPTRATDPVVDLLGIAGRAEPGHTIAEVQKQSNDVLGMFDAMAVSKAANGGPPPAVYSQQQSRSQPAPTFAQIPPKTAPAPLQPPSFAQPPQNAAPSAPTVAQIPPRSSQPPAFAQQPPRAGAQPAATVAQMPPNRAPPHSSQPPAVAQMPPNRVPSHSSQPPAFAQQQPKPASVPPTQPAPTYAQIPQRTAAQMPASYNPQQAASRSPPRPTQQPVAAPQAPGPGYNPQAAHQPPPSYPAQTRPPAQHHQQHPGQMQQRPPQQAYPPGAQQPQYHYPPNAAAGAPQPMYPGQQPPVASNLFAAAPPPAAAPAPQQPARSNVNQFDPMRRDPFA